MPIGRGKSRLLSAKGKRLRAHLRISDQDDKNLDANLKAEMKGLLISSERIEADLKNLSFSNQSISLKRISNSGKTLENPACGLTKSN